MSPNHDATERWTQVDRLFGRALELPEANRVDWLREQCADDPDLEREVETLLAAGAASADFLRTGAAGAIGEALDSSLKGSDLDFPEPSNDRVGSLVGPYRLVDLIGRGGMADVYLGEREAERFEQRVAVKIQRRGLDTDDMLLRFRAERQILSGLNHPNIARLIDGGATDDGLPYLVMEYIHGQTITDYCESNRLSVAARLDLFGQVARAVQSAHVRLVVHRDLKPSNILVNDEGQVKLLDFGIAKLLDPTTLPGEAPRTRTGLRPLTPQYASPEQVSGESITTASDVYQLGLVLYRLLTGGRPFGDPGNRRDLEQAITESRPIKPSEFVATHRTAPAVGIERGQLTRQLRGDLDTIVLKALRKDPARRYGSASELADDIRRHLQGRPILARQDSRLYRARKLVRRNAWITPVAAGFVGALGLYIGTLIRHGNLMEVERNAAQMEATKATAVRDFLTSIFEWAEPDAGGGQVSARELLDRSATRIEEDLSTQPAVLAELSLTLGSIYSELGEHTQASGHLERSIVLLELEPPGPKRDERLALALVQLAGVTSGSNRDSAAQLGTRAYRIAATVDPPSPEVANTFRRSAKFAFAADADSQRIVKLRSIEILRDFPDRRADMADALQEAAYSGGEDALAFQEEALRIRRALYGETHTSVAASLNDLAMVYDEHEPGTGDSLMQKAIEIDRELLGPAHATTLTLLNNYAWMKAERGDYEGAVPVFREVLAERERAYPEERWLLAYPLHGLGVTLMNAGRHAEAEQALRQTVEVLLTDEDSVSRLASLIAISRISLSKCLLAQGRFDESESMAGVALEGLTARPDLKSNADAARVQLEAIARAREETSTR